MSAQVGSSRALSPDPPGAARVDRLLAGVVSDRTVRRLRRRVGSLMRTAADALEDSRPPGYQVPLTDPSKQCLICGSRNVALESLTYQEQLDLKCRVRVCRDCEFVRILRPGVDKYSKLESLDHLTIGSRAGTLTRPGREFYMGTMGVRVLGRDGLDMLVTGAGRSMDNHHLARLEGVAKVAVGDIMRLRDDAEFIDVLKPPTRAFDLVIASEVVEHFRRPRRDFRRMLSFVKDDGLLVCGTNLNVGHPLKRCRYIFYPDHTSFYSPESLQLVARATGFHLDIRSPLMGAKRYLLFSKSAEVMQRVTMYFGRQAYAPSEVVPRFGEARRRNDAAPAPSG